MALLIEFKLLGLNPDLIGVALFNASKAPANILLVFGSSVDVKSTTEFDITFLERMLLTTQSLVFLKHCKVTNQPQTQINHKLSCWRELRSLEV